MGSPVEVKVISISATEIARPKRHTSKPSGNICQEDQADPKEPGDSGGGGPGGQGAGDGGEDVGPPI